MLDPTSQGSSRHQQLHHVQNRSKKMRAPVTHLSTVGSNMGLTLPSDPYQWILCCLGERARVPQIRWNQTQK